MIVAPSCWFFLSPDVSAGLWTVSRPREHFLDCPGHFVGLHALCRWLADVSLQFEGPDVVCRHAGEARSITVGFVE